MNYFNHDDSVYILTYGDMILFNSDNIWLKNRIVICFLRWISLQSSKITVLELMANDCHL